eukprot:gene28570-37533_t
MVPASEDKRQYRELNAEDRKLILKSLVRFIIHDQRKFRPVGRFVIRGQPNILLLDEARKAEERFGEYVHDILLVKHCVTSQPSMAQDDEPLIVDLVIASLDICSTGVTMTGRPVIALTTTCKSKCEVKARVWASAPICGDALQLDNDVMNLIAMGLFTNSVYKLSQKITIIPKTSICAMNLLCRDFDFTHRIRNTVDSLVEYLGDSGEQCRNSGRPLELVMNGLISARLTVLIGVTETFLEAISHAVLDNAAFTVIQLHEKDFADGIIDTRKKHPPAPLARPHNAADLPGEGKQAAAWVDCGGVKGKVDISSSIVLLAQSRFHTVASYYQAKPSSSA